LVVTGLSSMARRYLSAGFAVAVIQRVIRSTPLRPGKMRLLSLVVFISQSICFVHAQDNLDDAYFGLEFKDGLNAIQVAWVDSLHRTSKKLRIDDVVLSVGDLDFADAAELARALKELPAGDSIRFEVLALRDSKPRTVSVKSELLRDAVRKRFSKERDRDSRQTLYIPRLEATRLHIAVVEDFGGSFEGLRLRYYPANERAVPEGSLLFDKPGGRLSQNAALNFPTVETEYHYDGIEEDDLPKLSTLNERQMAAARRSAYIELQTDRTEDILKVIEAPASERSAVAYGPPRGAILNFRELTEHEQRNLHSTLLLYRLMSAEAEH